MPVPHSMNALRLMDSSVANKYTQKAPCFLGVVVDVEVHCGLACRKDSKCKLLSRRAPGHFSCVGWYAHRGLLGFGLQRLECPLHHTFLRTPLIEMSGSGHGRS
eukprot:447995-Amphidinium_carterae.1